MKIRIKKIPKAQNGSDIPVTDGLPDGMKKSANVLAEAGEVYENQSGDIKKINDNAPTHDDKEGGVYLGDASRVLENTSTKRGDKNSKTLALTPEDAELITGFKPKRKVSHSKALELADEAHNKQVKKIESKVKNSLNMLDLTPHNPYAKNSMELNFSSLQNIPSRGEVFDNLFDHQEGIKAIHNIKNSGTNKYGGKRKMMQFGGTAKYGFYYPPRPKTAEWWQPKIYMQQNGGTALPAPGIPVRVRIKRTPMAQSGALVDYSGAQTPKGRYTPTGVDVNDTSGYVPLNDYINNWKQVGLDLTGVKDIGEAQGKTYDYLLEHSPNALRAMWKKYGNTAQGINQGILTGKFPQGKFDNPEQLTIDDLKELKKAYVDQKFGPRRLLSETDQIPDTVQGDVPKTAPVQPPTTQPGTLPSKNHQIQQGNVESKFNEPLKWYDVAGPLGAYLSAVNRSAVPYNPAEFHQLRLQLQNPLPALQAGQTDYNAALKLLQQQGQGSGVANSNVANLFSKKYAIDNQILGQYENINRGIKNQEEEYNTQVRDKQSLSDQQAREVFQNKQAQGEEAQRLQKLKSLDDLYSRLAQNAKFNKEGNLIMKLAPAFNQEADYNGSKYIFRTSNNIPQIGQTTTSTTPKGRKQSYVIIGGVKYPISQ